MKNLHIYFVIILAAIFFIAGNSEAGFYSDRDFDGSDLSVITASFGSNLGSPEFNSDADLDGNGVIDNVDLSIFASFLGLTEKAFIERKSVMIPAATGGTISITANESLYSQGFELIIPPNALSQDTVITIGDSVSDMYSPPEGLIPLGLPIGLKPEGLSFLIPVTIKLHYSDEEMIFADISDISDLKLAYFDSSQSQWVDVPIIDIDEINKIITAQIDHFSFWNPFSWFENKKADEDPATPEKVLNHVKNVWGIIATNEEIEHVLYDESSLIPYSSEIGGLLTVLSMKKDIDSNNIAYAIKKGTIWLLKSGLKECGYKSLSGFASLASTGYDLLNGYAHILDKGVFNAQVSFYVHYKKEGMELNEMYKTDNGWLLRPGGGTWAPILTGKFHPADVYVAGEATYQAILAEEHLQEDEQNIKTSFLQTLTDYQTGNDPSASFSISPETKGNPPFTVNFDPSTSSAKNDAVIVEYIWNFDDGTQLSTTSPEVIPHTFSQIKTHDVELKVKDNYDNTSKIFKRVVVTAEDLNNQPPEANFGYTASSQSNLVINFDASLSNDPDGSIILYEWSFGDGNTATGEEVSNTYYNSGEHKVSLKVIDDNFKTTSIEKTIVVENADLNDGLVAYYPFNGNANDESGNGNDGTEQGGVALTNDRFGNSNRAYNFDGVDDYIEIPDSSFLNISTSFTLSGWIATDSSGYIISKHSFCPDGSDPFKGASFSLTVNGNGNIVFSVHAEGGNFYHLRGCLVSNKRVDDNQPHLVTAAFVNGQARIYVDNSLDSSREFKIDTNDPVVEEIIGPGSTKGYRKGDVGIYWSGFPFYNYSGVLEIDHAHIGTESLKIGCTWAYCSHTGQIVYAPFYGLIDDIRIYNRVLSEPEIIELYHLDE